MLNILEVDYDREDSIGQLRRRLKNHITTLRRGKKAERSQELGRAAEAKHREELDRIHRMWLQLIPQSLKNKRILQMAASGPMPYDDGPLRDLLLDPDGISQPLDAGPPVLSARKTCHSFLKRKKMRALSLANRTFLGPVPPELKDLTMIKETWPGPLGTLLEPCSLKASRVGDVGKSRLSLGWIDPMTD
ncbi:hypothetical protein B0H13DRAFT_1867135 [Mycena leptocephala]|nr:hypothetical protein B0H13DRAFT_1867135 [Mycena leptocephala]